MRGLPFRARKDGVQVDLDEREQEVLANLITDLRDLLMVGEHETLRRLRPPAHAGDEEAEAAYRAMVDDDMLRNRLELLDIVEAGLGGTTLDDEGVAAWMQCLNNIRLILGERLALDGADLEAHDLPEGAAAILFEWTGELLEFLVRAASR